MRRTLVKKEPCAWVPEIFQPPFAPVVVVPTKVFFPLKNSKRSTVRPPMQIGLGEETRPRNALADLLQRMPIVDLT